MGGGNRIKNPRVGGSIPSLATTLRLDQYYGHIQWD